MTILTIGVFDGVHRGHQSLLSHLGNDSIVITFSNHPAEVLKNSVPPQLCSLSLKLALLKKYGVFNPIVIPFTRDLSQVNFEFFLEPYSFNHLILGEGAAFGFDGQGNAEALRILGLKRGFTVQTVQKLQVGNQPISSSRIRSLILEGKLSEAEILLGHPYCIDYDPHSLPHIALPPDADYTIWSHSDKGSEMVRLTIHNRVLKPSANIKQLICFGSNLTPNLFNQLCQTSLAVS